ncbi:MAG TPA: Gfo/Idh/MocA family oxidoreductase [Planctomycetia bacterium]|nr:Gfo/Idh/MocA family oxidoreductase [Planctomycetia bacterium]
MRSLKHSYGRRDFLVHAAATGGILSVADALAAARSLVSPNERLNVGVVGVANRGGANLAGVGHENVVALCDVDAAHLAKAKSLFPHAATYSDFRVMLEKEPKLDAVVVSTPDHTHAAIAAAAMKAKKHVYCEKPLTKTVNETRLLRELAVANKLVTQMGTQIHAGGNYRRVVEAVQSGVLGAIGRCEVFFSGRPPVFKGTAPSAAPKGLDYDLWLGPIAECPYVKEQSHFNWRYWWRFGNGVLGDFGCHFMDLAFWALGLEAPAAITATGAKDHDGENDVPGKQKVVYEFAAKGAQPAITLVWRHGGEKPDEAKHFPKYSNGVLFIGEKGMLCADYSKHDFTPAENAKAMKIERPIPQSIGHHKEWLAAIRSGGRSTCDFSYSGALTETVLLGVAAYLGAAGERLTWDPAALTLGGSKAASDLLSAPRRAGWEL